MNDASNIRLLPSVHHTLQKPSFGVMTGIVTRAPTMRAGLSQQFQRTRRASAFVVSHTQFGVTRLVGSLPLGAAYDYSTWAVVLVSIALQVLGLPFLAAARSTIATKETFE